MLSLITCSFVCQFVRVWLLRAHPPCHSHTCISRRLGSFANCFHKHWNISSLSSTEPGVSLFPEKYISFVLTWRQDQGLKAGDGRRTLAVQSSLTYRRRSQIFCACRASCPIRENSGTFLCWRHLSPPSLLDCSVAPTLSMRLQMITLIVSRESPLYFGRAVAAYLIQTDISAYVYFLKFHKPLPNYDLLLSIQGHSLHINIAIKLLCDYLSMSFFPSRW